MQTIITKSENETKIAARAVARQLEPTDIILLNGNLGAGKSVFARALIRTLSNDDALEVPSPTFTVVQTYDTDYAPIWHFDLYRIKSPEDIYELGWEDAAGNALVIIEWPERLAHLKPVNYIDIHITASDTEQNTRTIQIQKI